MIDFSGLATILKAVATFLLVALVFSLILVITVPWWFNAAIYWGTVLGVLVIGGAIAIISVALNFAIDVMVDHWRYKRSGAHDRRLTATATDAAQRDAQLAGEVRASTIAEIATMVRRRGRLKLAADISALAAPSDAEHEPAR